LVGGCASNVAQDAIAAAVIIYVVLRNGIGCGEMPGFARIEGDPHGFRGININGGKNPLHPASFPEKGKTDGLLFAGGSLYASINLQDAKWPRVKHVLAWSDDQGATWSKANWFFAPGKGQFEPAKFLNFGPDYTGVPARLAVRLREKR